MRATACAARSACRCATRWRATRASASGRRPVPERRILVVEDTLLVAEAIGDMLTAHGCTVVGPVGRLGPALELARNEALDGALLDVNLAGEPCFAIAAALQE